MLAILIEHFRKFISMASAKQFQKLFRKSFSKSYLETLLEIFAMRAAETRLESVGESLFKEPFEIALAKMLPAILRSNAGGRHAAETGAGSEGRRIMRNAEQQLQERRAREASVTCAAELVYCKRCTFECF
jgi:hypothetical protein